MSNWANRLSDELDEQYDIAADVYPEKDDKIVHFDIGNMKCIEIYRRGDSFNFVIKEWDETGGIIAETDWLSTSDENELLELSYEIYCEFE